MFSSAVIFVVGVHGHLSHPLDAILSIRETPEQLIGLEKVTRSSINTGVSGKWVKSGELPL